MFRSAASKVMWVGRVTVFLLGVAVILALLFGVASTAFAHGGNKGFFHLGHKNVTSKVSKLIKRGAGPALNLRVGSGPPLKVNSSSKVPNLNADKLDGKDASAIGVNGLERVFVNGANNSQSPKSATANCPSGKVMVGTGFGIAGGKTGSNPDSLTNVVVDDVIPNPADNPTNVFVAAYEEEATTDNWRVTAYAICATAP